MYVKENSSPHQFFIETITEVIKAIKLKMHTLKKSSLTKVNKLFLNTVSKQEMTNTLDRNNINCFYLLLNCIYFIFCFTIPFVKTSKFPIIIVGF